MVADTHRFHCNLKSTVHLDIQHAVNYKYPTLTVSRGIGPHDFEGNYMLFLIVICIILTECL